MASRRIVLGIGNAERGDDAAGRAVARLFALHAPQAHCNGWPSQRRVMNQVEREDGIEFGEEIGYTMTFGLSAGGFRTASGETHAGVDTLDVVIVGTHLTDQHPVCRKVSAIQHEREAIESAIISKVLVHLLATWFIPDAGVYHRVDRLEVPAARNQFTC